MPPAAAAILRTVAQQNDIHLGAITGKKQEDRVVAARRLAARLMRDQGYTLSEIGRFLGGRHHTTILHLLTTPSPVRHKIEIDVRVSPVANHLEDELRLRLDEIEANRRVIYTKLAELDALEVKVKAMLESLRPSTKLEVVA